MTVVCLVSAAAVGAVFQATAASVTTPPVVVSAVTDVTAPYLVEVTLSISPVSLLALVYHSELETASAVGEG